jgi:hypothetical protein
MSFSLPTNSQYSQFRPVIDDQLSYVMSPRAPTPTSRNTHVRTPTPTSSTPTPSSSPTPLLTPRRLSTPSLSTVTYDCIKCNQSHKITYALVNGTSRDFKVISTEDCYIAYEIGKQILNKMVKDMDR